MIAAVLDEHGGVPHVAGRPDPSPGPGETVVRVESAGLNPVDLAVASGRFYAPVPDLPYVPGAEVVGRVERSDAFEAGDRVWGLCLTGGFAESAVVPDDRAVRVPEGVDPPQAVLAGVAGLAGWMGVRGRGGLQPGESVAILGASGVVGLVAIAAARAAGATPVVAVARSEGGRRRALDVGADCALGLDGDLSAELRSATDGGVDVVLDGLWGGPAAAAISALAPGGRLVQVGNSADPVASLPGGPFRGGRLDLRGFSVFSEPREAIAASYAELAAAIAAGVVTVPVEELSLDEIAHGWRRLEAGTGGVKLVVRPT